MQVYSGHASWFLPKNTAYTYRITRLLTALKEAGVLAKLFRDHFPHVQADNQVREGETNTLIYK